MSAVMLLGNINKTVFLAKLAQLTNGLSAQSIEEEIANKIVNGVCVAGGFVGGFLVGGPPGAAVGGAAGAALAGALTGKPVGSILLDVATMQLFPVEVLLASLIDLLFSVAVVSWNKLKAAMDDPNNKSDILRVLREFFEKFGGFSF